MICSVEGCSKMRYARGWCQFHYSRWHRAGDPTLAHQPWGRYGKRDPAELFWAKVDKSGDCWNWTAYVHHTGYGYFSYNGAVQGAHRVAWQMANGPIPEGMRVCHRCDNPICVRIEHLFLGTDADNAHDRDRKGRNINYRGAKNGRAKLTLEIAQQIRAAHSAGEPRNVIARRLGLGRATVGDVLHGRRWV